MQESLLPVATLVTPNLDEAEILAEQKIDGPEDVDVDAQQERASLAAKVDVDELQPFGFDNPPDLLLGLIW